MSQKKPSRSVRYNKKRRLEKEQNSILWVENYESIIFDPNRVYISIFNYLNRDLFLITGYFCVDQLTFPNKLLGILSHAKVFVSEIGLWAHIEALKASDFVYLWFNRHVVIIQITQ